MSKKALFMVHFGTTHNDTKELTIDKMNKKFADEFKDYNLFTAYTSRIVLKKLKDRGEALSTPIRVLNSLADQGYEELLVQTSHIIPGIEYENLVREVNSFSNKFKSIKIGKPLLYYIDDYKKCVEALADEYVPKNKKEALVLVCHGTDSPLATSYAMIEYVFDEYGYDNAFVVCTKAYPLMGTLLKKLKDRGEVFSTPIRVLNSLADQGYEELLVQTSHIIPGVEYENLVREVNSFSNKFKSIKIGKPLLYYIDDYKKCVEALADEYVPKNEKEALVLVCHGTDSPLATSYSMIEYVFDEYGYDNVFVVCTKAYPLMDTLIKKLKKAGIEEVRLAPFMFVAGEHAKNDMAITYKKELEENGFKVNQVVLKGLGEFDAIQNIFLNHLKKAIEKDDEDIADFKKEYSEKYL